MRDDQERPSVTKPPISGWVKGVVVAGALLLAVAAVMFATGHGAGRDFGAHTAATP